jgi:predicted ATPase
VPANLHLPSTVQAVLAARIDRLPAEEKELLQTLAVIGKEFSLSLLEQVADKPEEQLHGLLVHLQAGEFIYEQPAFPEPDYVFKHALTQEVAYNSLLLERRRVLHEQAAQALEQLFPARLEDHYGELAHHYSRSGNAEKAVEYLRLAGQQAGERSAYAEATGHFTAALELLKTLPETLERNQQELAVLTVLGPAVIMGKGFAVPELENIYSRARELCQQVGKPSDLIPVLLGLRMFSHLAGKLQTARALGEQALSLAQQAHDQVSLALAHRALGATLSVLGDLVTARAHLEQSITLYDTRLSRADMILYGPEAGILSRGYLAWTLWHLGYPVQARKRIHEALTVAQEMSSSASRAVALGNAIELYQYLREHREAQEQAEVLIAICTEQDLPSWLAVGTFQRGQALAEQGQIEAGITEMLQGLTAYQATGAELQTSCRLAQLAEAYGKAGRVEKGIKTLAEALTLINKNEERYYEAELYRLKGELTLQQLSVASSQLSVTDPRPLTPDPQGEAEACFLKAIDVSRQQQAKSLELRAATSLARFWQQQGKRDDARQMLAEVYRWFSEGFDTKDLREAKALLEELMAP